MDQVDMSSIWYVLGALGSLIAFYAMISRNFIQPAQKALNQIKDSQIKLQGDVNSRLIKLENRVTNTEERIAKVESANIKANEKLCAKIDHIAMAVNSLDVKVSTSTALWEHRECSGGTKNG